MSDEIHGYLEYGAQNDGALNSFWIQKSGLGLDQLRLVVSSSMLKNTSQMLCQISEAST